jgi:hypothetical protein
MKRRVALTILALLTGLNHQTPDIEAYVGISRRAAPPV